MQITITGKQGEGKTLLANVIKAVVESQHKSCRIYDEGCKMNDEKESDVIIITRLQALKDIK